MLFKGGKQYILPLLDKLNGTVLVFSEKLTFNQ